MIVTPTEDAFTVHVICAEESHADRPQKIERFVPVAPLPETYKSYEYRWGRVNQPERRKRPKVVNGVREVATPGQEVQLLENTAFDWATHGHSREGEFVLEGRTRYTLECPLCALRVTVRAERLDGVLDQLKNANVTSIQLSHLGAIVR